MAKKLNIKDALMKSGANIGGGVAAAAINKVGFVKKQKMVVRGIAKLAIGALLPSLLKTKGKSAEMLNDAVSGWNAVAGIELANGFITKNGTEPDKALSISGVGAMPTIMGNDYDADATYHLNGDVATQQQDIM